MSSQGFYARYGKRALDAVAGAAGLVVSAPVIAGCAVAIKLDDGGPVFFHQLRAGRDGELFTVHKLRTMSVAAAAIEDGNAPASMVTRVGEVLRRTSFDELPQFWNIMVGDMSVVGPRPTMPDQIERYTEFQWRRLEVLPGLTGLAQIRFRNAAPWSVRIKADVEYVENISLAIDLKILWGTVKVVLGGDNNSIDGEDVDDLGEIKPRPVPKASVRV